MIERLQSALRIAQRTRAAVAEESKPREHYTRADTDWLIELSLLEGNAKEYIVNIANQVNGTYGYGWYDACAVMLRRLIESLIIEAFVANGMVDSIMEDGGYLSLSKLIDRAVKEPQLNLSATTKRTLPRLKKLGDLSAHKTEYNTRRKYIDNLLDDFYLDMQVVVEEFVYKANP